MRSSTHASRVLTLAPSAVLLLFAASLCAPLTAQLITRTAVVTAPLTSQGFNCYNQTSWNNSVPTGPLSPGSTGVTGMNWSLGTSTLAVTASGSSYLCSFFSPAGYASSSGGVTVTLTSPFDTVVAITASGGASSSGGSGSGPLPTGGGVANGSVVVDGVTMFSVSATQGSSPSQTRQVVVGPAGVQIRVQAAASASYSFGGATGANLSMVVGWTQVDGANVVSVPGGCAAPTAIPTFVANGPARIGGLLDADILNAQGPSPLGFVMFGLQQAAIPLNVINMPGCTALQSKWVCLIATPVGPNELHITVPMPNQPFLVGVMLYSQAFTQALGVNQNDLVAGNALHWQLGN